jgi:hypothetical protein
MVFRRKQEGQSVHVCVCALTQDRVRSPTHHPRPVHCWIFAGQTCCGELPTPLPLCLWRGESPTLPDPAPCHLQPSPNLRSQRARTTTGAVESHPGPGPTLPQPGI